MNRAGLALLALLALVALGCERSSLTLELGLDGEDKAALQWLGYYPSHFEPVGMCPGVSAFEAQPVLPAGFDAAAARLKEVFAIEVTPAEAHTLTGKKPPSLDPAQVKSMSAEAELARSAEELEATDRIKEAGLEGSELKRDLKMAQRAMALAREVLSPTMKPYLVRGVSFSLSRQPEVQVCYGDVQVSDHQLGTTVPKMYRMPFVLWAATPPRRARISAGVTK